MLVVLGLPIVGVIAWGLWFVSSLQPDSVDLGPLEEISEGLEVVMDPKEYCPESADSCWGSVVLASPDGSDTAAGTVAANAEAAGFVEHEDHFRPWAAKRGDVCLDLFEPTTGAGPRAPIPAESVEIAVDDCGD